MKKCHFGESVPPPNVMVKHRNTELCLSQVDHIYMVKHRNLKFVTGRPWQVPQSSWIRENQGGGQEAKHKDKKGEKTLSFYFFY